MKITVIKKEEVEACFLQVMANVRYWDDAEINGETDVTGEGVPFKNGDLWNPIIDIDKGVIVDWPNGTKASFHFKICDSGSYYLLDEQMNEIASIDNNYVPDGLCHGDNGYGDYIIFSVNEDGTIVDYSNKVSPEDWIEEEE